MSWVNSFKYINSLQLSTFPILSIMGQSIGHRSQTIVVTTLKINFNDYIHMANVASRRSTLALTITSNNKLLWPTWVITFVWPTPRSELPSLSTNPGDDQLRWSSLCLHSTNSWLRWRTMTTNSKTPPLCNQLLALTTNFFYKLQWRSPLMKTTSNSDDHLGQLTL